MVPQKNIIDSAVHMYDTSYIINSKVIESLQTIEGKLNNSKILLGCKESTHICNWMQSKDRNIDERIDDVPFLVTLCVILFQHFSTSTVTITLILLFNFCRW